MLPRYETPPGPPHKEKLPEIRSLARHRWELTLRELIEKVRRDYGIELELGSAAIAGSLFLSKGGRLFPLPILDMDQVLPVSLLEFFCDLYDCPREDFGLDPRWED